MIRAGIQTKYLGPTNTKGSRVKAISQAGSLVVSWDYAKSTDINHMEAAQKLSDQLGWGQIAAGAAMPQPKDGYLFATSAF